MWFYKIFTKFHGARLCDFFFAVDFFEMDFFTRMLENIEKIAYEFKQRF